MQLRKFTCSVISSAAMLLGIQAMITVESSEATVYRCKGLSGSLVLTDSPTQQEQCIALPTLPPSSVLPPSPSMGQIQNPSQPDSEHGVREIPVPEAEKSDEMKTDVQPVNSPPQASQNAASSPSMPSGYSEDNSQKKLMHINPLNPFLPVPVE